MSAPQAHSGQTTVQNLIRHSLAPALMLDCNLMIYEVNAAMAALLKQPVGALVGQSFHGLFPGGLPNDLVALHEARHAIVASNIVVSTQIVSPALNLQIVRILGEFGGPVGFLVQADPAVGSENRMDWEQALQGAGQGVWDYDLSTGQKIYSKTWHDIRGLNGDDETAEDEDAWFAKIHPDDLELTKKNSADLEAGLMQTVQYEYRERHAQGHWIWIMCRGRAIAWDTNNRPTRYVGTDTDITALRKAQDKVTQLSETEIRWKNALQTTQQGLWDLNERTGSRFHSPQWFRMRGLDEAAVERSDMDNWLSRIHPDDLSQVLQDIERQNNSDQDQVEMEYRELHQDGYWIWILSRGRVVQRDETGRSVRLIGFDTDVSELKSAADRIRRISSRLEMALTASRVGVWEFDLNTNQVEWDGVMRDMYGLPKDGSALPRYIWENSLHIDDRDYAMAKTADAMRNKVDYSLDYRIQRQDGVIRHIRSRASHFYDPADGSKLIGLNWDVTQDHELAQELKDSNAIALKNNIQLEAARKLMEYNSLHDALTGLPNRRMLDQVQKMSADGLAGNDRVFAVLHVDLDRFKQINDTLGHAAGDAALVHIAGILRETVSKNDLVARVGGDEFAVFIEDAPPEAELVELAQKIIAKAAVPMKYLYQDCRCGVSIGIAYAKGDDIDDKSLFINADMAMYRSKYNGRGGCTVFSEDMKREALNKKALSDQLLTGLEQDEFFCLYQPQYDCFTLELTGVETLVRWNNPLSGVMSPAEFLPLAEELQVIDKIDKIVLRLALNDLSAWKKKNLHVPRLSINISGRRLQDIGLAQELRDLAIPSGILSFEFLESILLDEPDQVQSANISCIRELGIGIEVDDFGSGHSSIVSLLKLRPDRLKIDRTIVEPVIHSDRQRQLVQSIVDIGKLLGIKVLAEGVETEAHIKILQAMGCNELQGYGLSRPIEAAQLVRLLKPTQT